MNTLGAALFRAGRTDEAVQHLKDAIAARGNGGDADDWLFLAMAHQRLGQITEAREWLIQAEQWIDEQAHQKATGGEPDRSFTWSREIVQHVLRREAVSMIGGTQ